MKTSKPKRVITAEWMLYAVSGLGLLELFTSSMVIGATPLISADIIAYIILAFVAFIIGKRIRVAITIYTILAIIWYASLMFYLPQNYHHELNPGLIFTLVLLTIAAIGILYTQKSIKWFKENK
ncbi:MAG: hypothetical protein ACJA0H_002253 [Francisellaceae bacterium]|jgi:hypothetical protein